MRSCRSQDANILRIQAGLLALLHCTLCLPRSFIPQWHCKTHSALQRRDRIGFAPISLFSSFKRLDYIFSYYKINFMIQEV